MYVNKEELNSLTKEDFENLSAEEIHELNDELIDIIHELAMQHQRVKEEFEHLKQQLEINEIVLITQKKMTEKALKEIRELSITDDLTQVYNRRHFNSVSEQELKRAIREGNYFTLAIFDVDHFKLYNDNYGHLKGDIVLQKLGGLMNDYLHRPSDFSFRLGGEEFGIIFSGLDSEHAVRLCDEIRIAIEKLQIAHDYSPVSKFVTASFGVVTTIPDPSTTHEELYHSADEALYKAKKEGKNKISAINLVCKGSNETNE